MLCPSNIAEFNVVIITFWFSGIIKGITIYESRLDDFKYIFKGDDMQPKDAFTAITTTEKVTSSLYKWITGNRGFKRTVAIELQENIEIIRLYIESEARVESLIPKLKDEAFRNALAEGFNFNSLNRKKIDETSTKGKKQLAVYHGWETQKVFESVYTKISVVKNAVDIKDNEKPKRLGVRLHNIFKMMIMLTEHISE